MDNGPATGQGAVSALQFYGTMRELRKAMKDRGLWPAEDVVHTDDQSTVSDPRTTSPTPDTSTSSHASLYVRSSTLVGAPLTHEAVRAMDAYAKAARAAGEACAYTVIYEPVLRMATVRICTACRPFTPRRRWRMCTRSSP